ncbi:MAG: hypothetical protein EOP11_26060 [Proteobacteria bacterium]|nr:MAG: hypothetical protein EOP11_26060 [Pseudomonadota bacterium]
MLRLSLGGGGGFHLHGARVFLRLIVLGFFPDQRAGYGRDAHAANDERGGVFGDPGFFFGGGGRRQLAITAFNIFGVGDGFCISGGFGLGGFFGGGFGRSITVV